MLSSNIKKMYMQRGDKHWHSKALSSLLLTLFLPAAVQIHYLAHTHHINIPTVLKKTHGRKDLKINF